MISLVSASNQPAGQNNRKAEKPTISVVVPVYNSEESLPFLVSRLEPVLTALASEFELILVNDGSRDRGWEIVEALVADHSWITGIKLMRNFGQHNALLCGIREAHHDVIITMDDDLQQPPEEIPRLLEKLIGGYDVVYDIPRHEQHGLWQNMASQIAKTALKSALFPDPSRVVLIDMDTKKAALARKQKPMIQVVVGDAERLPFARNSLRFTVSNSVIEHVNDPDAMASEMQRGNPGYFLQTPNGTFPVETHSFIPIPFYNLVPARWIKKALCVLFRANFDYTSTVHYLAERKLKQLFPDARMLYEKVLGLKKSFYVSLAEKSKQGFYTTLAAGLVR